MTRTGKSNVLILGILTMTFAVLAGVLFYMEEQERHRRVGLEGQVAQLTRAKQQVEEELKTTREDKSHLEEEVASTQEEVRRLTTKLNEVSQSREELQATLAERDETLQSLNKDLEQAQGERERLNRQLAAVRDQAKTLENQLAQLKKERSTLETKLESLKGSAVELEKVVVTPEGSSGPIPTPEVETTPAGTVVTGRVLVVNREYDFVVVNVGKANGVKLGDEFEVSRENKALGRVKVEKIYEALSAAALLPGTDKQLLREGDAVRSVVGGNG